MFQSSQRAKFVMSAFLEACSETIFCGKWMIANDFCDAICHFYNLNSECKFDAKELMQVLRMNYNRHIVAQMEIEDPTLITDEHLGIFRRVYRPSKGKYKKNASTVSI